MYSIYFYFNGHIKKKQKKIMNKSTHHLPDFPWNLYHYDSNAIDDPEEDKENIPPEIKSITTTTTNHHTNHCFKTGEEEGGGKKKEEQRTHQGFMMITNNNNNNNNNRNNNTGASTFRDATNEYGNSKRRRLNR